MYSKLRSTLQTVIHSVMKHIRRPVAFTKLLVVSTALMSTPIIPITAFTGTAHADTDCGGSTNVVQYGSAWLGGSGVNICKNGDGSHYCLTISGDPTGSNCPAGQVWSGDKWQCVEMVNRLYLTERWTTGTWSGNGNTLINNLRDGLTDQLQDHISYVNPGDVVTETYSTDGHAGIINSVDSNGTIHIKSQNADLDSQASLQ